MNQEKGFASFGRPLFKTASRDRGITSANISCGMFKKAPDDINWTNDQAEFHDLLALKKKLARGPDGIPYGVTDVLVALDSNSSFVLFKPYWREVVFLIILMKVGLSLIPKTPDTDDLGRIIRSPDALRPLTWCNCDCKLHTSPLCEVGAFIGTLCNAFTRHRDASPPGR